MTPMNSTATKVIAKMWDAFHMANSVEEGRAAATEILVTEGREHWKNQEYIDFIASRPSVSGVIDGLED